MIQYLFTGSNSPLYNDILEQIRDNRIEWIIIENNLPQNVAYDIEQFCRDNGIIMTVIDNVELLKQNRLHGIHFSSVNGIQDIRENEGAHPIIGVDYSPEIDIESLRMMDIDYISVDLHKFPIEKALEIAWDVKNKIRLIARSNNFSHHDAVKLQEAGFAGFCISSLPNKNS